MATSSNRKKKFVVLASIDEKDPVDVFTILSEDHDVACHQAEISCGLGFYMALNKKQAQQVHKDLGKRLQDW